jgi:hypothetical protein
MHTENERSAFMRHSSSQKDPTRPLNNISTRLAAVLVLAALLGSVYLLLIRPRQLRWGATAEELSFTMPDDGVVDHPAFDATRAITIRGRPQEVWPWLVQMGYRRAGFYGYDLIENLGSDTGIRSAQQLLPAFQHPQTGDALPISAAATLIYGPMEANRYLVWLSAQKPPDGVFIWELVPIGADRTRLISRIRWRYLHSAQGIALGVFTEFGDHVAVRKILSGVRDRVEGRGPSPLWAQAAEIGAWILALLELGIGVVFVFSWPRWRVAWLLALDAGLLLQYVLYAPAPAWVAALLPWLYLALMFWYGRGERTHPLRAAPAQLG